MLKKMSRAEIIDSRLFEHFAVSAPLACWKRDARNLQKRAHIGAKKTQTGANSKKNWPNDGPASGRFEETYLILGRDLNFILGA